MTVFPSILKTRSAAGLAEAVSPSWQPAAPSRQRPSRWPRGTVRGQGPGAQLERRLRHPPPRPRGAALTATPSTIKQPGSSTTGAPLCVHAADHGADPCVVLAFDLPNRLLGPQLAVRYGVLPGPMSTPQASA